MFAFIDLGKGNYKSFFFTDHRLLHLRHRGHAQRHGYWGPECPPSTNRRPVAGERAPEAALRTPDKRRASHKRADDRRDAQDIGAGSQARDQRSASAKRHRADAGGGRGEEEAVVRELHA